MFTCPTCRTLLVRMRSYAGIYWACPRCKGRAVGFGPLRKAFGDEIIKNIWRLTTLGDCISGRPCPICARAMAEVTIHPAGRDLKLDVCKRCEFIWFDAEEIEMLPPCPKPHVLGEIDENKMTPEAREKYALVKVERMAEEARATDPTPDQEWKMLPAVLGLPVEMESDSSGRTPWLTWLVALGMTGATVFAMFHNLQTMVDRYGLIPEQAYRDYGLTFVTAFFLHGSVLHLVGNLYFLLIFGSRVEDYLGRTRWLLLIVVAALAGDLLHILSDSGSDIPCIGASGGISGLITFYALEFPFARLGILFSYAYVYFRWIYLPAFVAFLLWILFQIYGAWQQVNGYTNISSLAHIGGIGVGFLAWLLWRQLNSQPAVQLLQTNIS